MSLIDGSLASHSTPGSRELDWTDAELRLKRQARGILEDFARLQQQLAAGEAALARARGESAVLSKEAITIRTAATAEAQAGRQREHDLRTQIAHLAKLGSAQQDKLGFAYHTGKSQHASAVAQREAGLFALADAKRAEDRAARERETASSVIPVKAQSRMNLLNDRVTQAEREVQWLDGVIQQTESENVSLLAQVQQVESDLARTRTSTEMAVREAEKQAKAEEKGRREDRLRGEGEVEWLLKQIEDQGNAYREFMERQHHPVDIRTELRRQALFHSAKASLLEQRCGELQARLDAANRELGVSNAADEASPGDELEQLKEEIKQLRAGGRGFSGR
eukprot:Hpha_TRINITY_DN8120_c0_g1::TRINITY_DN8120_c0_g1_i1::g.171890::m.171890